LEWDRRTISLKLALDKFLGQLPPILSAFEGFVLVDPILKINLEDLYVYAAISM
jgi:hypothetical protein